MLIEKKIGHLSSFHTQHRAVDTLLLQWHECGKRILTKTTTAGQHISMRFLNEQPQLTEGDVLWADDTSIIVVAIEPCDCIVIKPAGAFEMANICYEIGNKHLPLFYEADELLVPFEMPLFNLLTVMGYPVTKGSRKLLTALKTTVAPHSVGISPSLIANTTA